MHHIHRAKTFSLMLLELKMSEKNPSTVIKSLEKIVLDHVQEVVVLTSHNLHIPIGDPLLYILYSLSP